MYVCTCLQVYSVAWKAATGVAAAEGLALGGWSCKAVRVQQAQAAAAAGELARLRRQATQELAALQALLAQQESSHSHEVCVVCRDTVAGRGEVGRMQGRMQHNGHPWMHCRQCGIFVQLYFCWTE